MRSSFEFLVMLAIAFALTWGIKAFVVQPFQVPTGSMDPTIEIGNYILSEKITYYFDDIEQGQIVTFSDPTTDEQTLVKRCIATGGQTVDMVDGFVVVDGVQLDEPYTHGKPSDPFTTTYVGVEISYPFLVPDGSIWVMGDNRTNSGDSRYFGPIPVSSVSGHAFFTYWPFDEIGRLV
ncbi:MAG: signal peptidase I [Actinobacteria bacterium]|nr:signal peptidase I [Actinomycetota bacterium]